MNNYSYIAIDAAGERVSGEIGTDGRDPREFHRRDAGCLRPATDCLDGAALPFDPAGGTLGHRRVSADLYRAPVPFPVRRLGDHAPVADQSAVVDVRVHGR